MKLYQYREFHTNVVVEDFMAEDYAMKRLGLTIEPKGKNGEFTEEQIDFKEELVEWFFSGNWIKEEVKDER